MASLNKTFHIGNLTRDPEVTYTPKGTAVCQIGLAVNHKYKTADGESREETTFIDVELWGKLAELAGEYLKKGRSVFVEGRLRLDTWDDKQTGQKRSKMKVVGESMQFLGSKESGDSQREEPRGQQQPRRPAQPPRPPRPPSDPDLDTASDDDIPF